MKCKLLELKARAPSLEVVRKRLQTLPAIYVGTFRQVDTYFHSSKGRLKLREVDSHEAATLIFYCREDSTGPKRSEVILIDIHDPEAFKALFVTLLGESVIVKKEREIYRYEGTQIHLDTVNNLGTFIEFERRITNIDEDYHILNNLMKNLEIEEKDLIQGSYSDFLRVSSKSRFLN